MKKKKSAPRTKTPGKRNFSQNKTSTVAKQMDAGAPAKDTTPDYTNREVVKSVLETAVKNLQNIVLDITKAQRTKEEAGKYAMLFGVSTPFGDMLGHHGRDKAVVQLSGLSRISIDSAAAKSLGFADEEISGLPMVSEDMPDGLKDLINSLKELEKNSGGQVKVVGPFNVGKTQQDKIN